MLGHVFVTRGDMRRLACDAWSLPCDRGGLVVPSWLRSDDPLAGPAGEAYLERIRSYFSVADFNYRGRSYRRFSAIAERFEGYEGWADEDSRSARFREWEASWGPRPWLVNVGSGPNRAIDWYCRGLAQYLEDANSALAGQEARYRRTRPLVAVHAIGTGLGGAGRRKAEMIFRQLEAMQDFVEREDCGVDLVFVAFEQSAFAAAQAWRRGKLSERSLWQELSAEQRDQARSLAQRAASGNLVAFLGAGVSIPAGLPGWDQLLREAAATSPELESQLDALKSLDVLDQAQVVERFVPTLREEIAQRLQPGQSALGHSLLASLPVAEFVTQNYDRLFELAASSAGAPVAVIPASRVADEHRWLLKMHGSVDRPEEIVLTREDYLRYGDRRAALAAIVQALLITKHMLFVGFSLSDPNFHRIADDVRKVLRPETEAEPFGSVLLLLGDELRETLWSSDLNLVCCGPPKGDVGAAARLHDLFLDCLLFESSASAAYLLDESYEHALSPPERELRDALRDLKRFEAALGGTPTWDAVARLLRSLGDT
jgi:hypothetical protein